MNGLTEQNMDYRIMLAEELERRQAKNSAYSLRAFAKSVGVSVATLSEVLNGKRGLSKKSMFAIADKLFDSLEERRSFLLSALGVEHSSGEGGLCLDAAKQFGDLSIDQFKVISDWFHLAILSLAKLENSSDPIWIADRLGISKREAKAAFDRLLRLKLIKEKAGSFYRSTKPLFVNSKVPSSAVRKYHQQNLEKAKESLEKDSFQDRDFSSITMTGDKAQLDQARKRIQKFREELSAFMEKGKGQEVYTLAVQLFPITKEQGER